MSPLKEQVTAKGNMVYLMVLSASNFLGKKTKLILKLLDLETFKVL